MNIIKKLKDLYPLLMDKYAECQNIVSIENMMRHPQDEKVSEIMAVFIDLIRKIDKL